jgi:hypothetical protein
MNDILFYDDDHERYFYYFCKLFGESLDEYRFTIAYLLGLDRVCREHYKDLFDFNKQVIKPEGINKAWQTSTSLKTTRLMFNLWNGYNSEGEPLEEETPSRYYTPEHIFSCSYAPYYWQAIKFRYPDYTQE